MYHFFVNKENIDPVNHRVIIEGGDVNHIRNVLRMQPGEEISVGTGEGDDEYRCMIEAFEENRVLCKLLFVKASGVESPAEIILFQGLPKADKMELIIQKCTELGVSGIVPVSCKRSVVKLDDKKAAGRIARWQGIAEAAAKQSKRAVIPKIHDVLTMKEALEYARGMEVRMIPYELEEGMEATVEIFRNIREIAKEKEIHIEKEGTIEKGSGTEKRNDGRKPQSSKKRIAIFIGPEGGFEEEEVALAKETGVYPISIGKRILRTETAGMVVIAWIDYVLEVEIHADLFG